MPSRLASPALPQCAPFRGNWLAGAFSTLILAIVPAVLWPGAVSWMCDEPMLIAQACYCNQAHHLASRGLGGTLVVPYGPFPIQFYQLLLLFTHDVRAIVVIHGFFLSALMAGSLLWLSRTLRLTPWFAAAIVLAPYLWWSQRVLWDASFALSIGMFAMAAYAAHLRRPSAVCLALAAGAMMLTPLIHLQALPLFAAFAVHALMQFRRQRRRWVLVPVAAVLVLIPNYRYIHDAVRFVTPRLHSIFHSGYADKQTRTSVVVSAVGPLLSGRLFDGTAFCAEEHYPRGGPVLTTSAIWISRLATPLICGGIVVAVFTWRKGRRKPLADSGASDHGDDAAISTARSELAGIALGALLLQILLAASLHVPPLPQYCFGTFPIHVLFGWLAIDFLQRYRLEIPVAALWGASLAFITLRAAWDAHATGWQLSPSLENQIQIAAKLNDYADQTVMTNVAMYHRFPVAIRALRVIMPPGAPRRLSPHGLVIRYTDTPAPSSRIELIERTSGTLDPNEYQSMDITPMQPLAPPVGWE